VASVSDEGEGDDVMNSEEDSGGDETDDAESLKDFIVEEDEIDRTMTSTNDLSTQSSTLSPLTQLKTKPFYEPTQFTATQETNDDDMPDIADLIGIKRKEPSSSPRIPLEELDAEDNVRSAAVPGLVRGKRRRRVVEIEDSDE